MAVFTNVVIYIVKATCQSPLRTGGTEKDNKAVLVSSDGIPMIQGSSIAGILRSYVAERYPSVENRLFGYTQSGVGTKMSALTVSDAVFYKYNLITRPRLAIDRKTGAGVDGHKFDLGGVSEGSEFSFELLLKTTEKDVEAENVIKELLSAVNSGVITFGGQRSNGFGRVAIEAERCALDLTSEKDRMTWRDEEFVFTKMELDKISEQFVAFVLKGQSDSYLIKSGLSHISQTFIRNSKITKRVAEGMKTANGKYVLPGSSLKGVLRSRIEMIADYLDASQHVGELFGVKPDKTINEQGKAGKIKVHEYTVRDEKQTNISRTRMDMFTGGVMDKSLFTEETLSSEVEITVDVHTDDPFCCGLVFYALRDMAIGLYGIGSESGVGRGFIKPETASLSVSSGNDECVFRFNENKETVVDDKAVSGFVEYWLTKLNKAGTEDDHE